MKQKRVKTKIRKLQITDAALEVIAKEGLSGLTIAAIAKKVDIAASNVYRHFSGREAVIDTLITKIGENLKRITEESWHQSESSSKCLEKIFFKHIEFLANHRGIPRVIFSDEMYSSNKRSFSRLRNTVNQYMKDVKKILKKGVTDKEFDPNLEIENAAMTFLGFIQSIALQWVLFGYSFCPKKRSKKVWSIYLKGIR